MHNPMKGLFRAAGELRDTDIVVDHRVLDRRLSGLDANAIGYMIETLTRLCRGRGAGVMASPGNRRDPQRKDLRASDDDAARRSRSYRFSLFTPTLLFATTLRAPTATILIAGCLGALALDAATVPVGDAGSFLDRPTDFRLYGLIGFSAFLLSRRRRGPSCLSPRRTGGRDAVLSDVSHNWLPFVYDDQSGQYVLQAPLGMYMAPGLVDHAFGLAAGHVALWLQNSAMLKPSCMSSRLGRGWRHAAADASLLGLRGARRIDLLAAQRQQDVARPHGPLRHGSWNPYFQVFRQPRAILLGAQPRPAGLVARG